MAACFWRRGGEGCVGHSGRAAIRQGLPRGVQTVSTLGPLEGGRGGREEVAASGRPACPATFALTKAARSMLVHVAKHHVQQQRY